MTRRLGGGRAGAGEGGGAPSPHASTHAPGDTDPIVTAAPAVGIGAGNTEGASTALARSDHDHTIRESGGQDLTMGAVADGEPLVRDGTAIVGRFAPSWDFAQRITPLATTSATPQSYLLYTSPSIAAGTYQLAVTLTISGSATSTQLAAFLEIDGVPRGGPLIKTGIVGGVYTFSGVTPAPLNAGVHTVELSVSKPAGTGTVTALSGFIILERKL